MVVQEAIKVDIYFNKMYMCNIAFGLLMVREKVIRGLEKSYIIKA